MDEFPESAAQISPGPESGAVTEPSVEESARRPSSAGGDDHNPTDPSEPRLRSGDPTRPSAAAGTRRRDHRPWPLRRSVRDRKLKGVAAGVAAATDIDPTLVRLLFVVSAFSGWGIVAYIALALVLKDETVENQAGSLPREQRRALRIGLAVAAAIAVGRFFDDRPFFTGGGIGWPLLLIAIGAAVLWVRRDDNRSEPGGQAWAEPSPLGHPAGAGQTWRAPEGPGVGPAWPWGSAPPPDAGVNWRSTGYDLVRLAAAFAAVGALLALLVGVLLVAVGAVPMRLPFLPAAVGAAGLAALVVAVVRRVRPAGLFLSGGVLVAAAALAVGLASFPGGTGNRVVVAGPDTPLLDRYEHGVGELVLDLGQLGIPSGSQRRVVAKVGAGQLRVIVPPGLSSQVTARAGVGTIDVFGRRQSGTGVKVDGGRAGVAGAARLELELAVGIGEIRVELPVQPTFEVVCQVPAVAKGDGTDPVTCPHPAGLESTAMTCSVVLGNSTAARPDAGRALCQSEAGLAPGDRHPVPPPSMDSTAFVLHDRLVASCTVPADTQVATCAEFTPPVIELDNFGRAPAETAPPSLPAPPLGGRPLACGLPDPTGERTCTAPPTSTFAPASYRCREDPATRQLTCVPA